MTMKYGLGGADLPGPITIVAFAHAGGSGAAFHGWRRLLDDRFELHTVELPGRGARRRDALMPDVCRLADDAAMSLIESIRTPFVFFGHSMGGLVAFETCWSLKRLGGRSPVRLFMGATAEPHFERAADPIHGLPSREFRAALERFNGTPAEVLANTELMDLVEPMLRADFQACHEYAPGPGRLDVPMTVVGGLADRGVPASTLWAWEDRCCADFRLRMVPGGHFFPHEDPVRMLSMVAEDLRSLSRA